MLGGRAMLVVAIVWRWWPKKGMFCVCVMYLIRNVVQSHCLLRDDAQPKRNETIGHTINWTVSVDFRLRIIFNNGTHRGNTAAICTQIKCCRCLVFVLYSLHGCKSTAHNFRRRRRTSPTTINHEHNALTLTLSFVLCNGRPN